MNVKFKVVANGLAKQLKREIEGYKFEVGIVKDKPHKKASFARTANVFAGQGFKTLKQGTRVDAKSTGEIGKYLDDKYHWLVKPWKNKKNDDVLKVVQDYLTFLSDKNKSTNRLKNALQAVVRNPILRGDYGNNAVSVQKRKGFNKPMIMTGQLFKLIKAVVSRRGT
ncbi:MAG: hypothetical protein LE178_06130 [Endomicrobium sp.]|nr:hypothetical protein [Endomicrobium sp.]